LRGAFALVRKSGIEPHRFLEYLTGTLFAAPLYHTYGTITADGKCELAQSEVACSFIA